jgi:hypothetical protein
LRPAKQVGPSVQVGPSAHAFGSAAEGRPKFAPDSRLRTPDLCYCAAVNDPTDSPGALRKEILELVRRYHDRAFAPRPFVPGQTPVPVSGRVFDGSELMSLVDASLDFWLTSGRFTDEFERRLARFFPIREAVFVNSGSSANLLALTCLTSPSLGDERLCPGDEVITVAAGFPTTVFPILQNRLVPVFVDIHVPSYSIDVNQLEAAVATPWAPVSRAGMRAPSETWPPSASTRRITSRRGRGAVW